jgi:uncharacterized protein (TIGR02001 family)
MVCLGAQAQLGASVAVDSDYRFRGVSLSDGRPTARLSLNVDTVDGWYAGAAATRVALVRGEHYTQLLPYVGGLVRWDERHRIEAGATFAHFTGDSTYDYAEAFAGVLADRWSARVYAAPNYFGRGARTLYAEFNAHVLLDDGVRLFGHAGALTATRRTTTDADKSRIDVRAGAGWSARDWDLQLAWVAATRGGPYPAVYGGRRSAWVTSASFSF